MVRPCFLILDPEYGSSISTRKLVIETAKMNVLTSFTAQELLETLETFPAVSGVVLNSNLREVHCADVVQAIKAKHPTMPVVIIGTSMHICDGADYELDTYDPARLLELLKTIEPRKVEAIRQRDEELSRNPDCQN